MIKNFLILFLTLILFSTSTVAENIRVFEFTDEEFKNLQVKKVKGETKWTLGSNENGAYIKAEAEGVGSGLGKEIEVDLEKQEITYGNKSVKFNLDSFKKKRLIEGLDNISLSMKKNLDIEKYENIMKKNKTWLTKND